MTQGQFLLIGCVGWKLSGGLLWLLTWKTWRAPQTQRNSWWSQNPSGSQSSSRNFSPGLPACAPTSYYGDQSQSELHQSLAWGVRGCVSVCVFVCAVGYLVPAQEDPAEVPGLWRHLRLSQPLLSDALLGHVRIIVQLMESLSNGKCEESD